MTRSASIKAIILLFLLQGHNALGQEGAPFWNEIKEFKKNDSLQPPPANAILFIGSSSIRLWKDVGKAFPKQTIINRGFGGSSLPDLIRYADEIIFPYQLKQIVIYSGENDLTVAGITADTVLQRFKNVFGLIRSRLPNVPVVFVSIKPSPSRWHLKQKMEKANVLIRDFLKNEKNTAFVEVWKPMLNKDGRPKPELFVADQLHMNEKGYAIWRKKIRPYLVKN